MKKSNNTISGWLDKDVDMTMNIYDMVRNQFHSQSELFLNKQEALEVAKFIYKLIQKRKEYESNK